MDKDLQEKTARSMRRAADHYAETVPPLAADIMVEHAICIGRSAHEGDKACQGCGTIQIIGQTARQLDRLAHGSTAKHIGNQSRENDKFSSSNGQQSKSTVIECLACRRFRKLEMNSVQQATHTSPTNRANPNAANESESQALRTQHGSKSANRISKERAKARKTSSLQAMLNSAKQLSSEGDKGELDLMDLMKDG